MTDCRLIGVAVPLEQALLASVHEKNVTLRAPPETGIWRDYSTQHQSGADPRHFLNTYIRPGCADSACSQTAC